MKATLDSMIDALRTKKRANTRAKPAVLRPDMTRKEANAEMDAAQARRYGRTSGGGGY